MPLSATSLHWQRTCISWGKESHSNQFGSILQPSLGFDMLLSLLRKSLTCLLWVCLQCWMKNFEWYIFLWCVRDLYCQYLTEKSSYLHLCWSLSKLVSPNVKHLWFHCFLLKKAAVLFLVSDSNWMSSEMV